MTKAENERWYKQDLARYLKKEFAAYKIAADRANLAYKAECYRQGTSRPEGTPEWDQEKILKNDLQHKIERKLPNTDLFAGVYIYYGKLVEAGRIDDDITHPEVLALMDKGIHIGRLHPVGSYFREVKRPERVYQITRIDETIGFQRLSDKHNYSMNIGDFQNKIKNGVIEYTTQPVKSEPEQLSLFDYVKEFGE